MKYINKIAGLINKAIKNPDYFKYQVHHYMKKPVSAAVAIEIEKRNHKDIDNDIINLPTYEFSNQACHPDMTFFKNEYWLTFTPYPYGMEEYENPTVHMSEVLDDVFSQKRMPIDKPKYPAIGYHLSDPCISENLENIYCFYRESIRKSSGIEINSLYYKTWNETKWSESVQICSSGSELYLSPAVIFIELKAYCYYAEWTRDSGKLICCDLIENGMDNKREVPILGIPDGYNVWHLSMAFKKNHKKHGKQGDIIEALFLLRSHANPMMFRLFYAESTDNGNGWKMVAEQSIPKHIEKNAKLIYKSCFIPMQDKILLSYRDLKDRYKLVITERRYKK